MNRRRVEDVANIACAVALIVFAVGLLLAWWTQ